MDHRSKESIRHYRLWRQHRGTLHEIAQLAHVTRPIVPPQECQRLVGEPNRGARELLAKPLQEQRRQDVDIGHTFAQGGQVDLEGVESVIEIVTKSLRGNRLLEV